MKLKEGKGGEKRNTLFIYRIGVGEAEDLGLHVYVRPYLEVSIAVEYLARENTSMGAWLSTTTTVLHAIFNPDHYGQK